MEPQPLGPIGVVDKMGQALGVVIAQDHVFRTRGRGRFIPQSLERIVKLGNAATGGLPCYFNHANEFKDGLSSYLGKYTNFRLSRALWREDNGKTTPTFAVRADLQLAASSFKTPRGNLAQYILARLSEDPTTLGTSLRLSADLEFETDRHGRLIRGDDGKPIAPIWLPTMLLSSDFVGQGDAVDSALSIPVRDLELSQRLADLDRIEGKRVKPHAEYLRQITRSHGIAWRKAWIAGIERTTIAKKRETDEAALSLTYRPMVMDAGKANRRGTY